MQMDGSGKGLVQARLAPGVTTGGGLGNKMVKMMFLKVLYFHGVISTT